MRQADRDTLVDLMSRLARGEGTEDEMTFYNATTDAEAALRGNVPRQDVTDFVVGALWSLLISREALKDSANSS